MKKLDIERLMILVVVAVGFETFLTSGLVFLSDYLVSTEGPRIFRDSSWYSIVTYMRAFPNLLIGIAIGYWLFSISETKRGLWFLLGLLAIWWSLAIYFLYIYADNNKNENT